MIVTYTTAEGHALADVLTPGVKSTAGEKYTHGFAAIEKTLGPDAPAREEKCSAIFWRTEIGGKHVLVVKSTLPPDTDGPSLPLANWWKQIIAETTPELVITTGTAGGVGADVQLGDVTIAHTVRWICEKQFKNAAFAHDIYTTPRSTQGKVTRLLLAQYEHQLGSYLKRPSQVATGDILTTDFFAFDDAADTYGLRKDDASATAVEMDDAALGLAIKELGAAAPKWAAIRNASDPQMNDATLAIEDKDAAAIYRKYGYWTAVGSVIACWSMVTGL